MHLFEIPAWALALYGVSVCLFALLRGGWRERLVGFVLLLQFVTQSPAIFPLKVPPWCPPALDVLILAACVACALRSRRYWTIFASSFALLSVITNFLELAPEIGGWAHASADRVWTILLVASLLAGAWTARRSRVG